MNEVQLVILEGPDSGREFPVSGSTVLGRDPSAGIVLDDSEASRRHASVAAGPGGAELEDLGSTNGTFLNGERIADSRTLKSGDKIRIGTTVLEVRVPVQATKVGAVIPEIADTDATRAARVRSPEDLERELAAQGAPQAEPAGGGTEVPGSDLPGTQVPEPVAESPQPATEAPLPASAAPQPLAAPPPQAAPAPAPPQAGFPPPPAPQQAGFPPPPQQGFGGPALPAQQGGEPPVGYQAGPGFQVRPSTSQWLLCAFVPFYSIIWYHRLCKELGEWSEGRIDTNPTTSVLAITLGAFLFFIPPIVSFVGTMGRIKQAQQLAGVQPQASFWGFIGRNFLLGYGYKWVTDQLNELAVRRPR